MQSSSSSRTANRFVILILGLTSIHWLLARFLHGLQLLRFGQSQKSSISGNWRHDGHTHRIRSTDPTIQSCFHLRPCSVLPLAIAIFRPWRLCLCFCLSPCLCLWLWDIPWRSAPPLHIGGKSPTAPISCHSSS